MGLDLTIKHRTKELLTVAETAALLGYSVGYVQTLCRTGSIPAVKLNGTGQWRVPKSVLNQLTGHVSRET